MLSINLDWESEKYLIDIISKEQTNSDELVKRLLRNYWLQLKEPETILERLGGVPKNLLEGPENLSARDIRKQTIAEKIKQKYDQKHFE